MSKKRCIFAPEHLAVPISVHLTPCGGQKIGFEPLMDFRPVTEDENLKPVGISLQGKTQGEIAAILQYNYPIFTDDFLFRSSPDSFEKLRSEYNYRREFYID